MILLRSVSLVGFVTSAFGQSSILNAQDFAGLPNCAQNCLASGTADQTTCTGVDLKCLCSNADYITSVACCLDTKCSQADQQKAVSFNVNLCNRVNVTVPNFLGCAVTGAAGKPGTTTQGQTLPATITGVGSPVSIAGNAPIAKFNGGSLLTGTCSNLIYASATLGNGKVLQFPWEGCSSENPACCPFDARQPGPLSVCPSDYTTTSGACCPSGWSIYTSALYGSQTPCYTTPPIPFTAPLTARALSPRATDVITTQLFSLRYPLKTSSGLSTGAIAGIAVGAGLGALLIALLLFFFIRRRRARRNLGDRSTMGPSFAGPMDKYDRRSGVFSAGAGYNGGQTPISPYYPPSEHISELPSPTDGQRPPIPQNELWFPGGPPPQKPVEPPIEMPGDTHIDQHHPAYSNDATEDAADVPQPENAVVPDTPTQMVSPMDAPRELGVAK